MLLTPNELFELYQTIDYFQTFFIATNLGVDILTDGDRRLLELYGIDMASFENDEDYISYAFKFGMMASALKKDKVKSMNFSDLKGFIQSGNFIPLNDSEKYALNYVKAQAYNDIKGLGNRIKQSTGQIFIESSRTRRLRTQGKIRKQAKIAIKDRLSIKELSSNLGHATQDFTRDFDRIADYIMHDAYQNGIAAQLIKQYGEDVEVFFSVYPKACKHCIEIYLTGGIGSEPKVFKLKDVIANGSNIGRKSDQWRASLSGIHNWCRCGVNLKPENSVWSNEKNMFILTRNTYGVNRKSKIKVTVTRK